MSDILSLNCLALGHGFDNVFTIKISNTETFEYLKTLIKEKLKPTLDSVSVHDLKLRKVDIAYDDQLDSDEYVTAQFDKAPRSKLTVPLSKIFTDSLDVEQVHVIVRIPTPSQLPPSSLTTPPIPSDVATLRKQFLQQRAPKAPSSSGQLKSFSSDQMKDSRLVYCNRPYTASTTIPVILLHPVFGTFVDACDSYKPTAQDNQLVSDLSGVMSDIYPAEHYRGKYVREVLERYGISLSQTTLEGTKFITDGDISVDGHMLCISEFKNEVGSEGAEPYFQAGCYYLEASRTHVTAFPNSTLPCMLILVFGPYIAFAGAIWADRPNLQIFAVIPFHFHWTDTRLRTTAARHLGSFRHALNLLRIYYKDELPSLDSRIDPRFPFPLAFSSLKDNTKQSFEYTTQVSEKLIFLGKLHTGDNICIKFVQHYCMDAHEYCALKGFAPTLRAFTQLPGSWYMVVMDLLDNNEYATLDELDLSRDERTSILKKLEKLLVDLHQHDFVHGDVRDTNIMVAKNNLDDIKLVDFDWSGEIGIGLYPMNVERKEIWRPEGVEDHKLITADHDIQMIDHMLLGV